MNNPEQSLEKRSPHETKFSDSDILTTEELSAELGCCLVEPNSGKIIGSDPRFATWMESLEGINKPELITELLAEFQSILADRSLLPLYRQPCVTTPETGSKLVLVDFNLIRGKNHESILLRIFSEQPEPFAVSNDALTGLPDRRVLAALVAKLQSQEPFAPFALLFMDIDDFKSINDQHGHKTGDQVLVELARRWTQTLRSVDFVCRYGGDEFIVVLPATQEPESVAKVVARLEKATAASLDLDEHSFTLSISIGTTISAVPSQELSELIQLADRNMYARKREDLPR